MTFQVLSVRQHYLLFLASMLLIFSTKNHHSAQATEVPFLRGLAGKCDRTICPAETPSSGDSCCYDGEDECSYGYITVWADASCQSTNCVSITNCGCESTKANGNGRKKWMCSMMGMAFFECSTEENEKEFSIGAGCTPP